MTIDIITLQIFTLEVYDHVLHRLCNLKYCLQEKRQKICHQTLTILTFFYQVFLSSHYQLYFQSRIAGKILDNRQNVKI